MPLPGDYVERVYAGVLGKLIGVYLGRPFEGWTYERIAAELGPLRYYVHERLGKPLIVADDDISGTFTFLRALPDHGNDPALTSKQIGDTWLNYIIEGRTILWWGGMGNSTEHTAFLRLKSGIPAPESGAIARNGKVVAEQIGAQIFVDGWAMVAPGDPERAADLARRAALVSHDGEAVHAARVLAAMEAAAFVERDTDRLLDLGVSFIPRDSVIARLIAEVRAWHAREPDWRDARARIAARYGYDKFGGNCHVVPNHALIVLGLLYGGDDFQRALGICNMSGWDTDCNSGNLGCLLGIKNGLAGIDCGPDWRGPVADRLYLSTADGGRTITDAVTETYHVVNIGRALAGAAPLTPKSGARYHFTLPGSVQGWRIDGATGAGASLTLANTRGQQDAGEGALAIHYRHLTPGAAARVYVDTFIPPEAIGPQNYSLLACPTLYPGQVVTARLTAAATNPAPVSCRLYVGVYDGQDCVETCHGPQAVLAAGQDWSARWALPDTAGQPIARIGIELDVETPTAGAITLDWLTWAGAPTLRLMHPPDGGTMWRRAWVNAVDHQERRAPGFFHLMSGPRHRPADPGHAGVARLHRQRSGFPAHDAVRRRGRAGAGLTA
ncbi:MAG: ADP-ribosylglycohydrolase family protein, partial [Thermomicrobiales bacterium]